jgi:hypothetical protein
MILRRLITLVICTTAFLSTFAQISNAVISGVVRHEQTKELLPYVNIVVTDSDDSFLTGTITNEKGIFTIEGLSTGDYSLKVSFMGFAEQTIPFHVGRLNNFLNLGNISLVESATQLDELTVTATRMEVASAMDKKTFAIEDNISQQGGSVLQVMQKFARSYH